MDFLLDWLLVTPENQLAYEAIRMVDGLEAARKELGIFMPKAFQVSIRESIELATEIVRIKSEQESILRTIRRDQDQINNTITIPRKGSKVNRERKEEGSESDERGR